MGNALRSLSLLIAIIATLGSLYFSEIRNYIPCELCWYQRILMYPLVIIITVSLITNDRKVNNYILPMSVTGTIISIYHYIIQTTAFLPNFCDLESSCTLIYINWLGFITIPFLSFLSFFSISAISILASDKKTKV